MLGEISYYKQENCSPQIGFPLYADLTDGAAKVVHGLGKTTTEEFLPRSKAVGVGNYGFTGVWYLYSISMQVKYK